MPIRRESAIIEQDDGSVLVPADRPDLIPKGFESTGERFDSEGKPKGTELEQLGIRTGPDGSLYIPRNLVGQLGGFFDDAGYKITEEVFTPQEVEREIATPGLAGTAGRGVVHGLIGVKEQLGNTIRAAGVALSSPKLYEYGAEVEFNARVAAQEWQDISPDIAAAGAGNFPRWLVDRTSRLGGQIVPQAVLAAGSTALGVPAPLAAIGAGLIGGAQEAGSLFSEMEKSHGIHAALSGYTRMLLGAGGLNAMSWDFLLSKAPKGFISNLYNRGIGGLGEYTSELAEEKLSTYLSVVKVI